MSKYDKLCEYVKNKKLDNLVLTYEKIGNILTFKIDHSFLTYKKELLEYGLRLIKYH